MPLDNTPPSAFTMRSGTKARTRSVSLLNAEFWAVVCSDGTIYKYCKTEAEANEAVTELNNASPD